MENTPNLALPYIMASQAQKHITHNEALRELDAVVQIGVLDRDLAGPPASPNDAERFIVANAATGEWAGQEGKIAAYQDNAWAFYVAREGWLAWVSDEDKLLAFDGTDWIEDLGTAGVNPTPLAGINTTADVTNRLAVSSPASLFTHEGSDHQLKINKAAAGDTASMLFQHNFSGRAEMGLTGDDDFHFKVSMDGAVWNEALVIEASTGEVTLPNTARPVSVIKTTADQAEPAIKMIGKASNGSEDLIEGVGLYMTNNTLNNRQFTLSDTQSGKGVRFLGEGIDGFQNGARLNLRMGSNTHGAFVNQNPPGAQFCVSNWTGAVTKTILEVCGDAAQTGDYLSLSSGGSWVAATRGDILKVKADGQMDLGGPLRLKSYTVATLPSAASTGTGCMIFVSDETDGAVPAFSDGSNWLRVGDRAVVS